MSNHDINIACDYAIISGVNPCSVHALMHNSLTDDNCKERFLRACNEKSVQLLCVTDAGQRDPITCYPDEGMTKINPEVQEKCRLLIEAVKPIIGEHRGWSVFLIKTIGSAYDVADILSKEATNFDSFRIYYSKFFTVIIDGKETREKCMYIEGDRQ